MPVPRDLLEAPPDRLDAILEGLFFVLLIFAPLALGAVEAWSELVVIVLAGAMAICLGLKFLLDREYRPVASWAYIPLGLFLLFTLFQLIPLPESVLGLLSPRTLAVKQDLLSDLPGALDSLTLTFYADGTLHDLRLALAVAAVFLVAVHIFRRKEALRRLLIAVTSIGTALALLSIAQTITATNAIYWLIPSPHDLARGASFINKNNFCQFINLSLGAALALLLLEIHRNLAGIPKTLPAVLDWIAGPRARKLWLLIASILICMAAVFLSLSRGGVIAMLIALTATAVVMALRQRLDGHAWVMVSLALGAFICVLFLGFDAVYDRLATLEEQGAYQSRWDIVRSAATAWTNFPLLGTGFGTHEVVFPMFDRSASPALFAFAENEYAQMAEETGLLGLLLVLAFGLAIFFAWRRCLRNGGQSSALAYGLGFGLFAVAIQSVGDFGLHIPAIACLAAAFCGVLVGQSSEARLAGKTPEISAISPRPRRLLAPLGLILTTASFGWALFGAENARAAESQWNEVERIDRWLSERDYSAGNKIYTELITHAESAVQRNPGKIHYRYLLPVFRWRAISRVIDTETGRLITGPRFPEHLRAIVAELHSARPLCPTYGPLYCMAGQLEHFFLDDEAGARHIAKGYELAPNHPAVCRAAGLLDVVEGRLEDGLLKLRRAVQLQPSLYAEISGILIEQISQPRLAMDLAGEDSHHLKLVTDRFLARSAELKALAHEARQREKSALLRECTDPEISAYKLARLARIHEEDKEYELAERCYQRALAKEYDRVDWRMQLAELYVKMNRPQDAIDQARRCLRTRPGYPPAERLLKQLEHN